MRGDHLWLYSSCPIVFIRRIYLTNRLASSDTVQPPFFMSDVVPFLDSFFFYYSSSVRCRYIQYIYKYCSRALVLLPLSSLWMDKNDAISLQTYWPQYWQDTTILRNGRPEKRKEIRGDKYNVMDRVFVLFSSPGTRVVLPSVTCPSFNSLAISLMETFVPTTSQEGVSFSFSFFNLLWYHLRKVYLSFFFCVCVVGWSYQK